MKTSCVLLAPGKEIVEIAGKECRKRNWSCEAVYCVNNQVAVELAKKYRGEGVCIFVSRGGMAKAIEKEAGVEVIPIEIGFEDVVEAVAEARTLGRRIGISINSALDYNLEKICSMFNVEVEIVRPQAGELLIDAIQKAVSDGIEVIIGGVAPIYFAQQAGVKTVKLQSGKSSVVKAIEKALLKVESGYSMQLFEGLQEGIVVLGKQNEILYANENAYKMLAADREENPFLMLSLSGGNGSGGQDIFGEFFYKKKRFLQAVSSFNLNNVVSGRILQIYDYDSVAFLYDRLRDCEPDKGKGARYVFSDILTQNREMLHMLKQAEIYARTNSTILILGETGTGKELLAQSIHNASYRRDKPFIAVNCSAIPESILESELFGYEPGAFTGALRSGKKGLFEAAGNGTIFLDEIGELSAPLQAKLLRVLQEKEIMRVGSSQTIPIQARVIAATLADLEEMMEKGCFRRDLFYRLNILNLRIPPLRERRDDIPLLVRGLSDKLSKRLQVNAPEFTDRELELFGQCEWEGNIRELENVLERIIVLNREQEKTVTVREMLSHNEKRGKKKTMPGTLKEMEREMILSALKRYGGDRKEAAAELGISESTLWRRMKEWDVSF